MFSKIPPKLNTPILPFPISRKKGAKSPLSLLQMNYHGLHVAAGAAPLSPESLTMSESHIDRQNLKRLKRCSATAYAGATATGTASKVGSSSSSAMQANFDKFSCLAGRLGVHVKTLHQLVLIMCAELEVELEQDEEEIDALQSYVDGRDEAADFDRAAMNLLLLDLNISRLQEAANKIDGWDNDPDSVEGDVVNADTQEAGTVGEKKQLRRSDTMNSQASSVEQKMRVAALKGEVWSQIDELELHEGHWDHLGDFSGFVSGMGRGPNRRLPCPLWCLHCQLCRQCNPNAVDSPSQISDEGLDSSDEVDEV